MGALSDKLLGGGCAPHLEAVHGQPVEILEGPDAGRKILAVIEIETDQLLALELGTDPRAKVMARFRAETTPRITSQARVRTEDGRVWMAIRQDFSAFLTNDFELREIVNSKDT